MPGLEVDYFSYVDGPMVSKNLYRLQKYLQTAEEQMVKSNHLKGSRS